MRFSTFVIIPATTSDIVGAVEQMMTLYDAERPVLPYRADITEGELALFLAQQGTSPDDPLFCEKLSAWWGYPCYHKEQGYFYLSSDNPRGYWDGWILHDVQTDVYQLPDASIVKSDLLAIVTPDGVWHGLPHQWDETAQQTAQRHLLAQQIFAQYPAHLVVLLDCHY